MEAANFRLSMPQTDSSYKHDSLDEYNLAAELEGDMYKGPHELYSPRSSYGARAVSAPARTGSDMRETPHARNFSRSFAAPSPTIGRNTEPEKGDWYLYRSGGENRKKWMMVAVIVLVIIAITLAATLGGVLGS